MSVIVCRLSIWICNIKINDAAAGIKYVIVIIIFNARMKERAHNGVTITYLPLALIDFLSMNQSGVLHR